VHIELFRECCLRLKGAEETFPFDNDTLVYKVMGKMFALISINEPDHANLKCDPERSAELRSSYAAVKPGWHMNKLHWNTIQFNADLDDKEIISLINHSYELVVSGLTKKARIQLEELSE